MLHHFKIDSLNYNLIISGIKDVIEREISSYHKAKLISLVGSNIDEIENKILKAFKEMDHSFGPYKNDEVPREVWIGGKCIAIEFRTYLKIKNKLLDS